MRLLHVTNRSGLDHDTGPLHPERPARLRAVAAGVVDAGIDVEVSEAAPATPDDLALVHDPGYIEAIRRFCAAGGGNLDADTPASPGSWEAALSASGAGLTAVDRLQGGFDGPAFVGVRPPGHHALADRAMGFCLFNNVAVVAARLRSEGCRVAILDWDVHHGNGTQDIFYTDPCVLYVSLHQFPFYPYQGSVTEVGAGEGAGYTINVPLPAFTAGDVFMEAYDAVALASLGAFQPDWLLVSCGFDGHAHDPLAELRLVEDDYGRMAASLASVVPRRRIVVFLEGGYHLPAIRNSVTAVIRGLVGRPLDLESSPHRSPTESRRSLTRVRGLLEGKVVGLV